MRLIKAILIDPFACTVSEVEYNADDYTQIYPLLSHEVHPVDTFTATSMGVLKGNDSLFVDDEGLYKNSPRWFQLATGHQVFAGKGLIIGCDDEGQSVSCATSLDMVRIGAVFLERHPRGQLVDFGPLLDSVRLLQAKKPWEPPQD